VAMLAYLKSRPDLRAVQLTPSGTIAARFTDGPGFVFDNTLDDNGDDGTRATGIVAAPAGRATRAVGLPQGNNILLLNGLSVLPQAGNPLNQFINEVRADAHLNKVREIFTAAKYQPIKD